MKIVGVLQWVLNGYYLSSQPSLLLREFGGVSELDLASITRGSSEAAFQQYPLLEGL